MAHSYLDSVHLHPLTFALAALDKLSSVELALVQFHLDNDEPGFGQVLTNARRIWEQRRLEAVQRGELLDGRESRPPSSLSSTGSNGLAARLDPPATPAPVPSEFFPLVETLRRLQQKPGARVMAASLGSTMRGAFRGVLSSKSRFQTFKEYTMAAAAAGLVETGRGEKQGQDWVRLLPPYSQTAKPRQPSLPPRPASTTSASHPTHPSPLPPDLFHLASLEFSFSPDDLASLPSHQLILLQFRKDPSALSVPFRDVERVFWRRRAEAKARGETWRDPTAAKAVSPLAIPSTLESPTSPPLAERLPDRVASSLVNLDLTGLPLHLLGSVAGLIGLLPPQTPCIAAGFFDRATPLESLRACLAFRTEALADEVAAQIASLPPQPDGLQIIASRSSELPEWRWRNVVPREREPLWREYRLWQDLVQGKKRRESSAHPAGDDRQKRRKSEIPATDRLPRVVRASDRVPLDRLESLYPLEISMDKPAKDLTNRAAADDAFVWRFGATAWKDESRTSGKYYHLLFQSHREREAFAHWLDEEASRYWKRNGVVIRIPRADACKQLDWRFRHFSHAWRSDNGFVLDRSDVAPTAGEFGRGGADYQVDHPDTGLFDFEFVLHGRDPPSPTRVTSRHVRSVTCELHPPPKRESVGHDSAASPAASAEGPRLAPSAVWSATHSSSVAHRQAESDMMRQTSPSPFPPAGPNLLPPPSPTPLAAAPPPTTAAPPSQIDRSQDQPGDPLQLSDLPAFSSALSAARLSPTQGLDLSSRPRRPTATDLNDFEMDVRDLFAVAARDYFITGRVKSEPLDDAGLSVQADVHANEAMSPGGAALVPQASTDESKSAPLSKPLDLPRPSPVPSAANLSHASTAESAGMQPTLTADIRPHSTSPHSLGAPSLIQPSALAAVEQQPPFPQAEAHPHSEAPPTPIDGRARVSQATRQTQPVDLPFSLPPSSAYTPQSSHPLARRPTEPTSPRTPSHTTTRPFPASPPTRLTAVSNGLPTQGMRPAPSMAGIPTGPRSMVAAGTVAARPPGLPAKPAFRTALPPQERL
ncbi:hypothetical protein NBRC10512_002835 [Rhodotorula toruloides]|uniref:RHTO0S08e02454g1_1 n=2 Tax=Rhodotorula toruloides TaxID=5286 RepID=A0A061B9D6_RHOTO|nr:uncharacterized protein RHTO_03514 [Rhodotorula toruloides NP11]EMS20278.1 hypothetical protein RHTO_03514 [Rhodotorula toruloides NP11]CDR43495.1 RHTO0S08e02454g1_1 [Rhodotorula toruloides]